MQPLIGWLHPAHYGDGMVFEHAIAKVRGRNVAVFGFAWSKTATKLDREQGAWSFLATFQDSGVRRRQNLQRDVAKKGNAIDLYLAPKSFLATHEHGCRWRGALIVSKRQAARYDCVLRAYGAPSAVEPCPAGLAGRFAPPPGIWRS